MTSRICTLLKDKANQFGHRSAITGDYGEISYIELWSQIKKVANRLTCLEGHKVWLASSHGPETIITFYSLLYVGAKPFVADPKWSDEQVLAIKSKYDIKNEVFFSSYSETRSIDFSQYVNIVHDNQSKLCNLSYDYDFARFSSGSTGMPKVLLFDELAAINAAEAWGNASGIDSDDKVLCLASLNNGLAFNVCLLPTFCAGAALILLSNWEMPKAVVRKSFEYSPTMLVAFPFIYELLLSAKQARDGFSRVRLFISSAAALPRKTNLAWNSIHGRYIGNYYGIAEAGPITFNSGDGISCGSPLSGVSIRVDEKTNRLKIKSRSRFVGYLLENDVVESDMSEDGYFGTNDAAIFRNNKLEIEGRIDDVINIAGNKYSTQTVIEKLKNQFDEADFAYVQHDDGMFTLCTTNKEFNEHEIASYLKDHNFHNFVPNKFEFIHNIPKSSTGKVNAWALKKLINTEYEHEG